MLSALVSDVRRGNLPDMIFVTCIDHSDRQVVKMLMCTPEEETQAVLRGSDIDPCDTIEFARIHMTVVDSSME